MSLIYSPRSENHCDTGPIEFDFFCCWSEALPGPRAARVRISHESIIFALPLLDEFCRSWLFFSLLTTFFSTLAAIALGVRDGRSVRALRNHRTFRGGSHLRKDKACPARDFRAPFNRSVPRQLRPAIGRAQQASSIDWLPLLLFGYLTGCYLVVWLCYADEFHYLISKLDYN